MCVAIRGTYTRHHSLLQGVAVCCRVDEGGVFDVWGMLQCQHTCCSAYPSDVHTASQCVAESCTMSQCVAVCCSARVRGLRGFVWSWKHGVPCPRDLHTASHCVAGWCKVVKHVAVYRRILQCAGVWTKRACLMLETCCNAWCEGPTPKL